MYISFKGVISVANGRGAQVRISDHQVFSFSWFAFKKDEKLVFSRFILILQATSRVLITQSTFHLYLQNHLDFKPHRYIVFHLDKPVFLLHVCMSRTHKQCTSLLTGFMSIHVSNAPCPRTLLVPPRLDIDQLTNTKHAISAVHEFQIPSVTLV